MSWAKLITAVKTAFRRTKWAVRDRVGSVVCKVKGRCHFNTYCFQSNALYFCSRCGKEMLGRTWTDIVPMTAEEQAELQRMDWSQYEGQP